MGQALSDALGDSPPPHDTLDPGPLSDAELAEALKRFAEHATDGALAQGAFDAIAENKQDDFAAAARHATFYDAARARAPTVDKRAFVAFCGVATRGSRSRRLEHVVTAGLGVRTLSDACDAAQTKRLAALMFSLVGAEPSPAVERALSMYEDARAGARTFGVLADEAWRDDRKPFGAGGCRLYTFAPAFAVARPRAGQSQDLLYLNTKGSASVPKGLIIGDGAVHVPTELGDARIKVGRSLAFESLALVDDATVRRDGGWVDVDELEVWAAGDAGALEAAAAGRARARGLRADHIARARKVDKNSFLNEFDQEMLLGKTFNTGADRART